MISGFSLSQRGLTYLCLIIWLVSSLGSAALGQEYETASAEPKEAATPVESAPAEDTASDGARSEKPKNIILMISDGAGFNAFDACSYYQYGRLGCQVYDGFPVKLACTHFMLDEMGRADGYDMDLMWSDPGHVRGEDRNNYATDSAAAATAIYTGKKTSYGRVSMDFYKEALTTVAEHMDREGKSTGAITSVQVSHATPACVFAHNESRKSYEAIAKAMIYDSGLDVIMGAGHPDFDDNNELIPAFTRKEYEFVGGQETWNRLLNNETGAGWTLIEKKADFEKLANATDDLPTRVIGVAQVENTLQAKRDGEEMGNLNLNVPTLETMTRAALNVLSQDEDGFFLMVEAGAVDWANHAQCVARMIEEQIDFNRSVEAAVAWIGRNGGWDENLLIITSDHECGMLLGEGTYKDGNDNGTFESTEDTFVEWKRVVNNGAGHIPGVQYGSKSHTNALVPLYAAGCGAIKFYWTLDGWDEKAHAFWGISGLYVDNTDIFEVMMGQL